MMQKKRTKTYKSKAMREKTYFLLFAFIDLIPILLFTINIKLFVSGIFIILLGIDLNFIYQKYEKVKSEPSQNLLKSSWFVMVVGLLFILGSYLITKDI